MRTPRRLAAIALPFLCLATSACVPLHPKAGDLLGRWRVEWACGTERLTLRADSTYVQEVDFAAGGHARNAGRWRIEPGTSLDGGELVLEQALTFCDASGKRLPRPGAGDVRLRTVWQWGRTVLEFNPDWQGLERE